MKRAILVNGVPASGKTAVAGLLTPYLWRRGIAAVPLSLDTVKEGLYAHIGTGDRDHNRMLGRASYHAIFASIAAFPEALVPVVDAWHGFQPAEAVREHIARAGIGQVVEVWCKVSPATAAARYRARADSRHAGHPPAGYADELAALAERARPLAMGPVVSLDTEAEVRESDLDPVVDLLGP